MDILHHLLREQLAHGDLTQRNAPTVAGCIHKQRFRVSSHLQKGQLGHGDLAQRNAPTIVAGLAGKTVIAGACGKHHTAVALSSGESFTWGSNLTVR